jgi:hypothetical protein
LVISSNSVQLYVIYVFDCKYQISWYDFNKPHPKRCPSKQLDVLHWPFVQTMKSDRFKDHRTHHFEKKYLFQLTSSSKLIQWAPHWDQWVRVHVGCSTRLWLTIQIEEVLFDDPQKLGCLTRIKFDMKPQLSNKTLFNLSSWPKLCSNNVMFD